MTSVHPAPSSTVPASRITVRNKVSADGSASYVLYWMVAQRRTTWNFALQRAHDWALALKRPLLILEALRLGYPYASVRLHRFILDGMADQAAACSAAGVRYLPYVEDAPDAGSGLLAELARDAGVVVGDESPVSFLPRMLAAAATRISVRFETVDSNGLLPLAHAKVPAPSAFSFRRQLQRELPGLLDAFPHPAPLARAKLPPLTRLPRGLAKRWPAAAARLLAGDAAMLAALPIDQQVGAVALRGGAREAAARLKRFLAHGLPRYAEARNDLDDEATSALSPYLHFGHISAHQVAAAVLARAGWTPAALGRSAGGKRSGWWGVDAASEGFLDQLVTWRELGYAFVALRPDHQEYASLPPWALRTLDGHAGDPREYRYSLAQFDDALTHDELWNAAQRQLRRDGRMHNYLRMLWGKKILEWSAHPREALAVMFRLNDRYALDGRDPNSSSGIMWCLGRFDRAWGPVRPVFGTIRYMSSASTRRKLRVAGYLERYRA
jgi:deoxyribodipyrimidine photo-lyase